MPTEVITTANDRLDRICYAFYGSVANREVEQVLDANPGIEACSILLPAGVRITLPDIAPPKSARIIDQIQLWE